MITESPDHATVLVDSEGKATWQFQVFIDAVVGELNRNDAIYSVATVPPVDKNEGRLIYVSDESGGATMAFSDGTDWRRVQDRAIIS